MSEFVCRVCGCDLFHKTSIGFVCDGCGVCFSDPYMWSLPDVKFVKLDENAVKPKREKGGDVGYEAVSIISGDILPGETVMFETGISVELPPHTEMQVRPRSGMAKKFGIMVTNSPGTIDTGYRGPCNILLTNTGTETYTVSAGDRIAQFLLTTKLPYKFTQVDELSTTDRGVNGFGHTGK